MMQTFVVDYRDEPDLHLAFPKFQSNLVLN